MTRITGLSRAERRAGWTLVQLDGASHILVPDEEVRRLRLTPGAPLDPGARERLERAAARAEAMRIALRYLSVRPRSRREIERHLGRKRLDGRAIDEALARLDGLGYVNDLTFATAFARDRIRIRPCGVRRMRAELLSRGVAAELADEGIRAALDEEATDEARLLERAARRRSRRLENTDPEVARRRLFAFLSRRGFDRAAARSWIDAWRSGGRAETRRVDRKRDPGPA